MTPRILCLHRQLWPGVDSSGRSDKAPAPLATAANRTPGEDQAQASNSVVARVKLATISPTPIVAAPQPRPPLGHDGGPYCEGSKQHPQPRAYDHRGHTYGHVVGHREPVPPDVSTVADHRLDVEDRAGEIRKEQPGEHPGSPLIGPGQPRQSREAGRPPLTDPLPKSGGHDRHEARGQNRHPVVEQRAVQPSPGEPQTEGK